MTLKEKLSRRLHLHDIQEIVCRARQNTKSKQELYDLLFDSDDSVAYQAAWVLTHFSTKDSQWLYEKQDELIDEVLACSHTGKRRLILTLLYRQPFANPPRIDFLDFCMERMKSIKEPVGIRSLCMKLSYVLCRPIPELVQELASTLEMMEGDLPPAIQAAKRNILSKYNQNTPIFNKSIPIN